MRKLSMSRRLCLTGLPLFGAIPLPMMQIRIGLEMDQAVVMGIPIEILPNFIPRSRYSKRF
jgi:hypothetical protein